jgi:hypothetical protein
MSILCERERPTPNATPSLLSQQSALAVPQDEEQLTYRQEDNVKCELQAVTAAQFPSLFGDFALAIPFLNEFVPYGPVVGETARATSDKRRECMGEMNHSGRPPFG